jgi:hypothetical protein
MAEGDFTLSNKFKNEMANADTDLAASSFKIALIGSGTPNIDTSEFWDDLSAGDIVASGYTADGQALASLSVTRDDTNDWSIWDFTDPSWASLATATITYAVIYRNTGVASTSPIVGWIEIATNSNGNDYTVQLPVGGILRVA